MKYRSDIDGLRAFSVLTVILFHLDFAFLSGGFIGVDTFFVISGYLITGILVKKCAEGQFSFADFYMRRVKRIFPALFTMLAFTLLLGFFFLSPETFKNMVKDAGVAGLQFSNFRFAEKMDYFQQSELPSVVLHTWSLGVEEQFYLVWPVFIWLCFKFGFGRKAHYVLSLIFIVSLGLNLWLIDTFPQSTFYLLHTRAWELALGGLVALYHFRGGAWGLDKKWLVNTLSLSALVVLLACSLFYTESGFPGAKAILPCVAAALLMHFGRSHEGVVFRLLSMRPVVFIGLISYGLYLWHWPLIVVYKSYTSQELVWLAQFGLLAVTFALTLLCYRFIEKPLRYSKLSAPKTLVIGFLTMGVFFGITALVRPLAYHPIRIDAPMNKEEHFAYSALADKCHQGDTLYPEKFCVIGDENGQKTGFLSGASHAGHYTDMVDAWGKAHGVKVTVVTKNGCPLWLDVNIDPSQINAGEALCQASQQQFKDWFETAPVYDYAFLAMRADELVNRRLSYLEKPLVHYAQAYKESLARIMPKARQVVVLGQVPINDFSPPNCYFAKRLHVSKFFGDIESASHACLLVDKEVSDAFLADTAGVNQQVAQDMGVSYYDASEAIFTLNDGTVPFYKDNDHLTPAGSLALLPSFSRFMEAHVRNAQGQ